MWVRSLGQEDPLEEDMAIHSSFLAWRIPWTEEPGGLQSSQYSSVTQLCPTLCDPVDCSMPGFPVYHQLLELAQTHNHRIGDPSNHLILRCPLLLLPSIFPSIRVFSKESVLHIRWPKLWSFSFTSVLAMNIQD